MKTVNTQNKERLQKAAEEKSQIIHIEKVINTTADFSMKTLEARRAWSNVALSSKRPQTPAQKTLSRKTICHNRRRKKNAPWYKQAKRIPVHQAIRTESTESNTEERNKHSQEAT